MPNRRNKFATLHAQVDVANRDEFTLLGVESFVDVIDDEVEGLATYYSVNKI